MASMSAEFQATAASDTCAWPISGRACTHLDRAGNPYLEFRMLSAAIPHSIRTALLEDPRHFEDCLDRVLVRHRGESRLFPVLFKLLAHLDLSEEQARQLYVEIRQHQSVQAESQNRHVDFRVAMMDYLVSVKPHFVFPKVIELK